jgi:hypothetical protein
LNLWDYKLLHRGPLEWLYLCIKFNDNTRRGSEIISGRHTDRQTDRQTGDLIRLLSFLESRLKMVFRVQEIIFIAENYIRHVIYKATRQEFE